jgi:hypothetical protein
MLLDNVKEEHGMGRGCICREWAGDVGLMRRHLMTSMSMGGCWEK